MCIGVRRYSSKDVGVINVDLRARKTIFTVTMAWPDITSRPLVLHTGGYERS